MTAARIHGKRRATGSLIEEVRLHRGGKDPVAVLGRDFAQIGVEEHEVVIGRLKDDGISVNLHGGRTALIHQFHAEILPDPLYHFSKCHLIAFLPNLQPFNFSTIQLFNLLHSDVNLIGIVAGHFEGVFLDLPDHSLLIGHHGPITELEIFIANG